MPDGKDFIPEKKELPQDGEITDYGREQLQDSLMSTLVTMGILQSKKDWQAPVRNGVPQVFVVKDGEVMSLGEAGLALDSPLIVDAMIKGQLFAYPLGEKDPVQIQGIPRKSNAVMEFRISEPLSARTGDAQVHKMEFTPEPQPPARVREPRWYHKLFSFLSSNKRVLDDYAAYRDKQAEYETAHAAWQKNLEAEAKQMNAAGGAIRQVADKIYAKYGAGRTEEVLAGERELKRAAEEAQRRQEMERQLADMKRHSEIESKGVEIVRNVYAADPKPIQKYVSEKRKGEKGLYTMEDFSKLTKVDIDLDKLQLGGKPVTKEQFATLAMFASLDPDVALQVQNDAVGDPKPVLASFRQEGYNEQEAKEVIASSVSASYTLDVFTGDERMYKYFQGMNMGKDLAARALKAYPRDKSQLAEIFSRAVESGGITAGTLELANDGGSNGSPGLNKLAREAVEMMDQDPELRQLAKEKYEQREREFCKNHKLFKPRSFEDRIRDIRGFGKLCDLEQEGAKARQTLMQANLDGEPLSRQRQNDLVKTILKANLAASIYEKERQERRNSTKLNGVNKGPVEFEKYTNELSDRAYGDDSDEEMGLGTSGGGSTLAANMPTIVISGLQYRVIEKPPTMERMLQPDQLRQLDRAAEQVMRSEGLDKASLDQVCQKVTSWSSREYRGENMIVKAHQASLNAQKQREEPELAIRIPDQERDEDVPHIQG